MAIYRGPGGAGDATNDATSQAILAVEAANAAVASQAAAAGSASSAATSATNAASSATSAANSATTATTEASNAATSATNAANSAATATTKASEASTSATNAAASESAAASSATAAASSATSASNSATLATTKASEASTSATSAASSANAAAASATTASTQATNASNSAAAAATSETNAANSATAAATSATNAASSATTATTQATNAASSATAAATSASTASGAATTAVSAKVDAELAASTATTQATNASNSASAAATSAANASSSATAAASSATAAAASAASINPADLVHISGTETITGAKTFSTNPTISSGTANGVAYLNGSKVLTTGSALTFDGNQMVVGGNERIYFNTYANPTTHAGFVGRNTSTGAIELGSQTIGGGYPINFYQSGNLRYQISNTGESIWSIGSEQMRLTSTGLGIGTSSPAAKLHSYSAGTNLLTLEQSTNTGIYARWKRPNQSYILALDIGNNGGRDFSLYDETAGTTRLMVDGSGNLGLGVTPSAWSTLKGLQVGVASLAGFNNYAYLNSNAYYNGSSWTYINSGYAAKYDQVNSQHAWYTAPSGTAGNAISFTPAMTLAATGVWSLGDTGTVASSFAGVKFNGASYNGLGLNDSSGTSSAGFIYFQSNGTLIGSITRVGATSAVAYNTSSDYRLKENIQPMQNALGVVVQLNPVTYTWKADGSDGQGFIAHELQAVVPDCVTGEKDAVDAEGKPVYQGVDTSFLVATLTAAIQELKAELDATKAEVAALKAIN